MLIQILAILSIVGLLISTMMIVMKGINFITLGIANAILRQQTDINVDYLVEFIVFSLSSIILACLFVYRVL